ncbi:hypothetical protein [Treponema phagedenis]|nr:hypothetical protein [Treponema phagedenis]QEJ98053.1 hypothetical protein FUT82_08620 [Treponema phagedenis]QEK01258.1 hypothetical protein FUT84_08915 [Treponema phagedenis]QEK03558.1 hypothetical protein FUT83_06910 [Treponema phagedenis]QEK06277.1 hypothetical protein FUT80_05840 [Treponema phagedenis]QSH93540.1 hypothetical protein C5O78_00430 [Treponema phagedenis]
MYDTPIIAEKLHSLDRCLSRIKEHVPVSIKSLEDDFDVQDIITLNLQRAVQISVDIASHVLSEGFNVQAKTMAELF